LTVVGSITPTLALSFARTLIFTGVSLQVVAESLHAVGGHTGGSTVTQQVATFEHLPDLSFTV
jgi:hypothetical protein